MHVASDLHVNVYRKRHHHGQSIYSKPHCDAVIFAGDMSEGMDTLRELELHYHNTPVFWVSGNHEFYQHDINDVREKYQKADMVEMYYLDNSFQEITVRNRKFRVLGATLWTDYEIYPHQAPMAQIVAKRIINDHRFIRNGDHCFSPYEAKMLHEESVQKIDAMLSECFDGPTIVVTHHLPSPESLDPKYYNSGMDPAFASDLNWLILKHRPLAWIHGHTHCSRDYKIGNTRVICNPRGYDYGYGPENTLWNPNFILEI